MTEWTATGARRAESDRRLALRGGVPALIAPQVQRVLPAPRHVGVVLNIVGATCLLVWTLALVSQLILRRRADRAGAAMPVRMRGFPVLTLCALGILGVIFALLVASPDTRAQFLSMAASTAVIATLSALARRRRTRR